MLWNLAWKNTWRNKRRSLIIAAAIAFGLWGGLVSAAIELGLTGQSVTDAIQNRLSDIQIHSKPFQDSHSLHDAIPEGLDVLAQIRRRPHVRSASARIVCDGMASTTETAQGATLVGIDAAEESRVTAISDRMIDGTYLTGHKKNEVIIGEKLAGRLAARVRSKIVLTMQDVHGNITAGAFRVTGIYRTESSSFDEATVFVRRTDLGRILDGEGLIHEIAVRTDDDRARDAVCADLQSRLPDDRVQTWSELEPELQYIADATRISMTVLMDVILLALLFGIVNTMLMAVMERTRELGVLMAVGMKGSRVFGMILLESVFLSLTGAAAGMLLGAATIGYFTRTGIDLSSFAEGLASYGYASVFKPRLPWAMYPEVVVSVMVTAVLAAVYPALKAIRLRPSEAIRTF